MIYKLKCNFKKCVCVGVCVWSSIEDGSVQNFVQLVSVSFFEFYHLYLHAHGM